jgi:hypothetical protein
MQNCQAHLTFEISLLLRLAKAVVKPTRAAKERAKERAKGRAKEKAKAKGRAKER